MPTLIQDKIDRAFSDLVFDERRHLYFVNNVNYPSVSSLISGHTKKVDFNAILPYSALKASREEGREVTQHELKKRWQTKNKTACELGHQTHDFLEHFEGIQTPSTPQQQAGINFIRDYVSEYSIVKRELRMYSRKWKYAGTSDLLLEHLPTGRFVLGDWKTNEDLFKNYKGQTLAEPFDYLEDTPYNKYQLQLSYYEIMLNEADIKISDRLLIYLKADETYKVFSTVDMKSYILDNLSNPIKTKVNDSAW